MLSAQSLAGSEPPSQTRRTALQRAGMKLFGCLSRFTGAVEEVFEECLLELPPVLHVISVLEAAVHPPNFRYLREVISPDE